MKERDNNTIYLYRVLYVLIAAVSLFPVSCNYIMSGGIVGEWIARVEEISEGFRMGRLYLFPSAETVVNAGYGGNGMNSNFCFFLPGFLHYLSGNIVFSYRVFMLLIQTGTLLTALLFFQRIFADEESGLSALFGVLLYMTCPYRIYVCYDWANLSQATVWMLMPLYAWAAAGILSDKRKRRDMAVASLALAGMGYADVISFLTIAGLTLLVGFIKRKLWIFLSAAAGGMLFLPGIYRLMQYLFLNRFTELNLPIHSIMKNGYRFGEYFSVYTYEEGHPGMGIGMLLCLLAGVWLWFVKGKRQENKICRSCRTLSILLLLLSACYFPWDLLQRAGDWALKLVSLIETPAVFCGMAYGGLSVVGADTAGRFSRQEDGIPAAAAPVIILLACLGLCIYQCNMLTYTRQPLTFL